MDYRMHKKGEKEIAEIILIDAPAKGAQDFLDLIGNVPARRIILKKEMLDEGFFDLRTGMAGEILQKVSNYDMKLSIVGDFTQYSSRSLRDFIHESNHGNQVVFVGTAETAIDRFAL